MKRSSGITSCGGGNSVIIGGPTRNTKLTVEANIYIESFIFYDVCYDIKNKDQNQTESKEECVTQRKMLC